MMNESRLRAAGWQLPEFLDAEAVALRRAAVSEAKARDELLRHAAAAAFGKDGRARADVGAGRVIRTGLAVAVEAHVSDPHARDAPIGIHERFGRRESGKHVDAQRLRALRHPGNQLAERDD